MKSVRFMLMVAALVLPPVASAISGPSWTASPLIVQIPSRSRMRVQVITRHINSDHLMVYPSTEAGDQGRSWRVATQHNKGTVSMRGKGGYYWVQVREQTAHGIRFAATVQYFSNPGPAPRGMLAVHKAELAIQPLRLPREHRHFRANEQWPFQVLYHGQPVAGITVELQTQQGTVQTLVSDKQGLVRVSFPDDFPAADNTGHEAHAHRRRSDFVLTAVVKDKGQNLLSSFNYHYTPGAYADKSRWLGAGFALLGMAVASPLLRGRARAKKETSI